MQRSQRQKFFLVAAMVLCPVLAGAACASTATPASPDTATPATTDTTTGAAPNPTAPATGTLPNQATPGAIVTSGTTFGAAATAEADALTSAQADAARALRVYFEHASVGENIRSGLSSLAATPKFKLDIRTWDNAAPNFQMDTVKAGWNDYARGNPGWKEKVTMFKANVTAMKAAGKSADVAMMKLCYIDGDAEFGPYRDAMLELEAAVPGTVFVWWTMPVTAPGDGENVRREAFNKVVRDYAAANKKWLFDIAAVESAGTTDPAHGNVISLKPDYTSDGGHLNDTGAQVVGKALWSMLAKIAAR